MRPHSDEAWNIAATFGYVLSSDTRTLAAMIDDELDREREGIAQMAEGAGEPNFARLVRTRIHGQKTVDK